MMSQLRRIPAWLWAAALLPRLILLTLACQDPSRCLYPDSVEYLAAAYNMVHHFSFSTLLGRPDTLRTPGYPLFLSPFALLSAPGSLLAAALAQCLLGALTTFLAWLWIEPRAGNLGAAVGAGALALDLSTILHTPLILAETLFTFALLMALISSWEALGPGGTSRPVRSAPLAAGAWWGLAIMIKPIAIFWPAFLAALMRSRRRAAAAFLLGAYLMPFLWSARNKAATGHWVFSSVGSVDLLAYPAAGASALAKGGSMQSWSRRLQKEADAAHPESADDVAARGRAYAGAAIPIMASHPFSLAAYMAIGALKILGGTGLEMMLEWAGEKTAASDKYLKAGMTGSGTLSLLRRHPALAAVEIAYLSFLGLLYFFAVMGWLNLWKKREKAHAFLLMGSAFYFLGAGSIAGYYRFRLPVIPFLAVSAAFGAAGLKGSKTTFEAAQEPFQTQQAPGHEEP